MNVKWRAVAVVVVCAVFGACTAQTTIERPYESLAQTAGREALDAVSVDHRSIPCDAFFDVSSVASWGDGEFRCERVTLTGDGLIGEKRLPVVIFEAREPSPDMTPVFYLHGGPGGGAVAAVADEYPYIVEPFNDTHDVVVFDQRGAGLYEPAVSCDGSNPLNSLVITSSIDRVADAAPREYRRCATRAERADAQPETWTAEASADDAIRIADALGYESINVLGVSWGGLVAQHAMARHPARIRAAVLDSPLSMDTDLTSSMPSSFLEALLALDHSCRRVDDCHSTKPTLADRFEQLAQRFRNEPIELAVYGANDSTVAARQRNGSVFLIPFQELAFVNLVFLMLYDSEYAASLPALFWDLENNDTRMLSRFTSVVGFGFELDLSFTAPVCGSVARNSEPNAVEENSTGIASFDLAGELPDGRGSSATRVCSALGIPTGPATARPKFPAAPIPTLILAGSHDPITPLSASTNLARELMLGRLAKFDGRGHSVIGESCGQFVAASFLAEPNTPVSSECLGRIAQPEFTNFAFADGPAPSPESYEKYTTAVDEQMFEFDLPEQWVRDWETVDLSVSRDLYPTDFTRIVVLAADEELSHEEQRDAWLGLYSANRNAEPEVIRRPPTGIWWKERSYVSPFGLQIVERTSPRDKVTLLLIAYPDEVDDVEGTAFEHLTNSFTAAEDTE